MSIQGCNVAKETYCWFLKELNSISVFGWIWDGFFFCVVESDFKVRLLCTVNPESETGQFLFSVLEPVWLTGIFRECIHKQINISCNNDLGLFQEAFCFICEFNSILGLMQNTEVGMSSYTYFHILALHSYTDLPSLHFPIWLGFSEKSQNLKDVWTKQLQVF